MATQKATLHQKQITVTLTDEEVDLLEAFAAEQGVEDLERAIPAMIHELVRLHDQLWDAQFAQSTAPLEAEASSWGADKIFLGEIQDLESLGESDPSVCSFPRSSSTSSKSPWLDSLLSGIPSILSRSSSICLMSQ